MAGWRVKLFAPVDRRLATAEQGGEEGGSDGQNDAVHPGIRGREMLNFSCALRTVGLAAGCLALAACAARDAGWQRPNTSDAIRAADYNYCRGEAKSVAGTALGIDQDIAASRGEDWRNTGTYAIESARNSGSDDAEFSQVLGACMTGKGYRPA